MKYIKHFFIDWTKTPRSNGLIMTNIFDDTFGKFGTLVSFILWLVWFVLSLLVLVIFSVKLYSIL